MASLTMKSGITALVSAAVLGFGGACAQEPAQNGVRHVPAPFSDPVQLRLAEAACQSDVAETRRSLDEGAAVDGEGEDGITPLFWALRCRSFDGVRVLLERGADPNRVLDGRSTVEFAARLEDVRFLELFLRHGADPNTSWRARFGSLLDIALMRGVGQGMWDHWDLLLRSSVDINRSDHNGDTTAMRAARLNVYDRVIELLDRGYNHDLPKLREIVTSSTALRGHADDPDRIRLVAMLDERIGRTR